MMSSICGENKLNAHDRLKEFIDSFESYFSKYSKIREVSEEFEEILNLNEEDFSKLTQTECFAKGYMLYQYADILSSELNKNKNILMWCDNAINQIAAREVEILSTINKHEIKMATILNENQLASKINEWKMQVMSRINMLESKEYTVKRRADCLIEKGKRK